MPKITLFDAGTVGVDLKTNPLFLGKKKLHSAVNLIFTEGVLKTRPGIEFCPMGCAGVFQGSAEFFPKKGLSTAIFSDLTGGVVVAVGGKLYFNCEVVEGVEFPVDGNVNLFQAENYLIIQHEQSETYWWDGVNPPVKSPGMQEQDWSDPEMPLSEPEVVAPVADIPECAVQGRDSGITLRMIVVDDATDAVISGAYIRLDKNGNKAYDGVTDLEGNVVFYPTPRTYEYMVTKDGYIPVNDRELYINGTATEVIYEVCAPPAILTNGEFEVVVRLEQLPESSSSSSGSDSGGGSDSGSGGGGGSGSTSTSDSSSSSSSDNSGSISDSSSSSSSDSGSMSGSDSTTGSGSDSISGSDSSSVSCNCISLAFISAVTETLIEVEILPSPDGFYYFEDISIVKSEGLWYMVIDGFGFTPITDAGDCPYGYVTVNEIDFTISECNGTSNSSSSSSSNSSSSSCSCSFTGSIFTSNTGDISDVGFVTVENTGCGDLEVLSITCVVDLLTIEPTLPYTITQGESQIFNVTADGDIRMLTVDVTTDCGVQTLPNLDPP